MGPKKTLRKTAELIGAGDLSGAEKILSACWPDIAQATAEAQYLLGLIRRGQRRPEDALRLLKSASTADPSQARYHFAVGDLLASLGNLQAGAQALAEALRLDPEFPNARRAFARAALNAGRAADAEAAARVLLSQAPDADAWDILSCALREQERVPEAVAAAEEAVRLAPSWAAAQHNWAVAIGLAGRVEEALAAFEQLAAQGLQAGALAVNRGAALLELGRAEEAETVLSAAAAQWPFDMSLQIALAKARWLSGAGETFTAAYEDAIARNPGAARFRVGCVDLLSRAGFAEKAEAMLQKGLQRQPGEASLLDALGALFDATDRFAEAAPLLEAAILRDPGRDGVRSHWITALLHLGRSDEALKALEPVRAAAPLNQIWIALESLALRQLGDARYDWLCDYEHMVRAFELPVPPGFSSAADFNEALAASLMPLHVARGHPLDQSLRQGTQSTRNLTQIDDPVIRAFLAALTAPIREYIAQMREPNHPWSGRKSESFRLANAWSVRLKANGFHVNHVHPQGWISSAYYVSLPEGMDKEGAHSGWIKFGEPPAPMPGCTVEKVIQPQVGRLVLFPSYMWHGTVPFGAGERLTAPFDVVPV